VQRQTNTAFLLAIAAFALYLCYRIAQPFLTSIFAAIVLAIVFYPLHVRVKRLIVRPQWAASVSTLVVILVVIVPTVLLGIAITRQLGELNQALNEKGVSQGGLTQYVVQSMQRPMSVVGRYVDLSGVDLRSTVLDAADRVRNYLIGLGKSAAKNLPGMLLRIVVVFFTLFFLFRDGPRIVRHTLALLPLTHEQAKRLLQGISDTIVASVYGSVAVGVGQGILTGLAFWVLGLPSPVVAAVLAAVASLIPLVGTGLVWVPGAVLLLLSGHGMKALVLLILGSAIIAQVDVVIRPYVVSESAKLNGLLILFALLGGIEAFGIMGVIIGPVVISVTIAVLNMLQEVNNSTSSYNEKPAPAASE
jgi:predicted PurR-regulated permease PerM